MLTTRQALLQLIGAHDAHPATLSVDDWRQAREALEATEDSCPHEEDDLEVVTLPRDHPAEEQFVFRGMRFCTACHTIVIHVGEDVERIEVTE